MSSGAGLPYPAGPATTAEELLGRARRLGGWDLSRLAGALGVKVPVEPRRAKGWAGDLLEKALSAPADVGAGPDFPDLGVELKTLPVDARGQPRESTWVCVAPLDGSLIVPWERSPVRAKLNRVLFVPLVGERGDAPGSRRIGSAFSWSPSAEEEAVLHADWDALTELVALGQIDRLTARHGEALQVRPKAADARERAWALAEGGEWVRANPRGFYLRATFTAEIVRRRFALPG